MKRLSLLLLLISALTSCENSIYNTHAPRPHLAIHMLQESFVIGVPLYVQTDITQEGNNSAYQLSTTLVEGQCDLAIAGEAIPAKGQWVELKNTSEVISITPLKAGKLKINFEAMNAEGIKSGQATINIHVDAAAQVKLDVEYAPEISISEPIKITLTAHKSGFAGVLPILYECIEGQGVLSYGALTVSDAASFDCQVNAPQVLYYTPKARGRHKFQLSITDGTTADRKTVEIIVTY